MKSLLPLSRLLSCLSAWRNMICAALAVTVLASCGGGGLVPVQGVTIRPLSAEFQSRKATSYSPFRTGNRDTESITPAQILADLQLLLQGNFRLIRLFDSSDMVARATLDVIRTNHLDMKVQLGAYVVSGNDALSQAEINRAVTLANTYSDIVLAVSVGNETMVSWAFNAIAPKTMLGYLQSVRSRVAQPVTTDDFWSFFANEPGEKYDPTDILNNIDFVSMHSYPMSDTVAPAVPKWDWQQLSVPAGPARATAMMNAAVAELQRQYAAVRNNLDVLGRKSTPITIGETGWKAVATHGETYRAHPMNQKMYFDGISNWLAISTVPGGPTNIFWFEGFDEPWKQGDDGWGLFNVGRKARSAVQALYPSGTWDTTYTIADAVYYPDITAVSATRLKVFSDVAVSGEFALTGLNWYGFDSPPNAYASVQSGGGSGEDANFLRIVPAPSGYGWGMLATATQLPLDLRAFGATGSLSFRIRSSYGGKLQVGFFHGPSSVYVSQVLSNTNADGFGFVNDGQWHNVSIPIRTIVANSSSAVDLSQVASPLVIADIYGTTGNTNTGDTRAIDIDAVTWTRP